MAKIERVAHIGLEVADIDSFIAKLQLTYPERGYKLIRKFRSVGVPAKYEGSECVIAQVRPNDSSYPELELFAVGWRGKYREIAESQRRKLVEHIALSVSRPQDVESVIRDLAEISKTVIYITPLQVNKESNEIFSYLMNDKGEKIEIVCRQR